VGTLHNNTNKTGEQWLVVGRFNSCRSSCISQTKTNHTNERKTKMVFKIVKYGKEFFVLYYKNKKWHSLKGSCFWKLRWFKKVKTAKKFCRKLARQQNKDALFM
jgi:hypothetical protein